MAQTSAAMVLRRPGEFAREEYTLPSIGADDFLLRVELVTICGGDLIEYQGLNRKASYPLLMGHEMVGTVESIGDRAAEIHGVDVGDRIMVEPYLRCGRCGACIRGDYQFCAEQMTYGVTISCEREPHLWGAYSQYMYGAPGSRVHQVDPAVPREAAALTTVIGNGVRWVRDRGQVRPGEGVLVTGLGVQALSSVLIASLTGAAPIVVVCQETDRERLALAREYGADLIMNSRELAIDDGMRARLRGLGLQVAIECTGAAELYALAIDALAPLGRIVAVGTRGGRALDVDLDGIVFKELSIVGGLGQTGATELAADIVNSGKHQIHKMVTHTLPLARAAEAIELCMSAREDVVHVGLDPWAD
jgi:alcohol dehydrogenase